MQFIISIFHYTNPIIQLNRNNLNFGPNKPGIYPELFTSKTRPHIDSKLVGRSYIAIDPLFTQGTPNVFGTNCIYLVTSLVTSIFIYNI